MQTPTTPNEEPAARTNHGGLKFVSITTLLTPGKDRSNGFLHHHGGRV